MLEHKKISNLDDYFVELQNRQSKGVYFYRINGYSEDIAGFIKKYYDVARRMGVVIEGKIPNPDEKNLAYYNEMMGMAFSLNADFFCDSLKKWLPRMNDFQRRNVADSIFDALENMKKTGKTENMLKNAYIKFMCWLYYKFERIGNQLGENNVPKILYEGDISNYELMLISILAKAGCDVVLLQYNGDTGYLKLDPENVLSDALCIENMAPFPKDFNLKKVREDIQNDFNHQRLYGALPAACNCTNAWIKGRGLEDIKESIANRGSDPKFYYNCYCRINGVEDKTVYVNDLLRLYQEMKNSGRKIVIVNNEIEKPSNEEIAQIKRGNYSNADQMILDLAKNIKYTADLELQKIMHKAFVDVMLSESEKAPLNINRLTNKAVYLLCWLKRYTGRLFSNWHMPEIACFIYMGGCKTDNEAFFISFLAKLPVDILILCPNLNVRCCLKDRMLYEENYSESMVLDCFPEENMQVRIGTVAYHAERELDTLMYQNSGIYRNQQYSKANVISLQTMYEEIRILWDQELKYRPNFSTNDDVVNIPVICAKISGVKDGLVMPYWASIKELVTEDTILFKGVPCILPTTPNPMKACAHEFYKNGKLQKQKIKSHSKYMYGILREETQEFLLDKLQILIEQRLIKGIGENGTEYTAIAQVLNLPKNIVRMIQKFDFTKKNPKVIYINTSEKMISLEDSIMIAFLNLVGFDILFFVPTGYQCVEKYFAKNIMEEHQIGEYKYDLQVPDLNSIPLNSTRPGWREKIFKRGN